MNRIAINGFGRIGRLAFRQMFEADGYEVVAINDLTSPKMLAHLLKYDTAQGGFAGKFGEGKHTVDYKDAVLAEDGKTVVTPGSIIVDGKEITIYAKPNAAELPWGELKVDVVLECTGFYTSKAKASAHIEAGAKKVVISAPAGNDLPTIVYNTNHKTLTPADTVISAASCTTNCLAPMAKALNELAGIESGIMVTIHAYTGDQMILDGPQRKGDLRRSRAGAANITPTSSGAAKAIGLVLPELDGKLIGAAQRVPVFTGSSTFLTATVKKAVTAADKMNTCKPVMWIVALFIACYMVYSFATKGFLGSLNMNFVIFMFVGINSILFPQPRQWMNAHMASAHLATDVMLQFPFYGGIMGMMYVEGGLGSVIVSAIVSVASAQSLPVFVFLSACIVNIFIPSQGGQFTVQGPLIVGAVNGIEGANLFNCLNAFVYGDECTNLIQPLYMIPALAVVGMKLKDVWGFMAFICVFWVVVACLGLYFLPMIFG